ncbi:MAG: hypothetical protein J5644_07400 [Bacteroidales bacterium]|nr:hypothetical protein [Bacteroidales bacterium]
MKKNIIVAYSAIILVILLYACTTFPAFPDELRAFFPYSTNEKISFHNEEDSIVTFTVNQILFSEQHTIIGRTKCCKDESHLEFNFRNIHVVTSNELSNISGLLSAQPTKLMFSFSKNGQASLWEFPGNPYEDDFTRAFGDTILLSNDYGEAIFVKNKGLVKFDGFRSTWYLVE